MIDVTIKTLDSRNHAFSVEDDLTVKQFKEHIAEPINIPVESQRLIYCGRVLVDEKKLSEYNVNGKVIHLVQRPPPSVAQSDNNSGESSEPRSTTNRRPWRALFNPGGVRVDTGGNAMYLGAMAFPADLMDAQGITMPNPRHGLSQSRLQVVRSMLRRARNSLQSLENPVHQESPTEYTQAPPAASATNVNFGDVAVLAQAFTHGVTRAAATLNLPTATPVVNVEVGTPNAASGGENSETVGAFGLGPDVETVPDAEPFDINATSASASEETASTTEPGENNNRGGRSRYPTTIFLAGLLHQVMSVNRRLQPFLETYHDLMREDPTLENPAEAQRLFNQVSEILHFMSHAYHAISDVMCDFSQPPPRLLQCRPVLIQHSAVLQTGIPIQLNLGGSRSASNNNASTTASTGSTSTIPEEPAAEATTANSAEQPERESPESTNSTGSTTGERRRERRMWQSLSPTQTGARGVQISPSNLEIFMDVGQGSITFDSVEATVVSGNGSPPPSGENGDFMSFVQALGHVRQALGALGSRQSPGTATSSQSGSATSSTTSPSSTQPSSDRSRSFAPGATSIPTSSTAGSGGSQPAWPNSGTQPTTSTQTRSSSSHVHISPGFQGMGVPGFFDPFLPCNSHHIRGSRRRPQQTQSDVDTTSSSGIPTFTATIQAHVEPRGGDRAPGGREAARNASSGSASSGTGLDSEDISRGTGGATNNGNERDSSTTSSRRNWVLNQISRMLGDRGEGESVVRRIRSEPNDVTVVVQASAQLPRDLSPETPLLPLIQESRYPDSIFTDIFLRMARHLTVRDVRDLNFDHLLTTVRPALRRYIRFEFLRDRDSNLAISEGINRLNVDIRPIFESVLASLFDIPMREDVDIVATFNQLNHSSLPRIIRDILESDDSSEFIRNITQHWIEYTQNLASLFCFTCLNGDRDAKCAFIRLGIRFMSQIPGIENWDEFRIPYMVRQFATRLAPTSDSVREFIVFRMGGAPSVPGAGGAAAAAAVPQPPTAAAVAVHDQSPSSPPVVAPVQPPAVALSIEIAAPNVVTPQQPPQLVPMEIEDTEVAETVPTAEQISEPLPDVIIGAEQWHNQVPSDWVPIITRDRDRQRRQAAQSPLSDAYLSGMPNKRRKIVSSAKPHGSISKILTDTVTTALATAGVNNTEGVAEAAGVDAALRTAHKEQLKATVSATLRSHPDFTPEKYPNAAKFIAP